jgi:hypothetical protein
MIAYIQPRRRSRSLTPDEKVVVVADGALGTSKRNVRATLHGVSIEQPR